MDVGEKTESIFEKFTDTFLEFENLKRKIDPGVKAASVCLIETIPLGRDKQPESTEG